MLFDSLTANIIIHQALKNNPKESSFLLEMDLYRVSDNMAIKEIKDIFKKTDQQTSEKCFINLFT